MTRRARGAAAVALACALAAFLANCVTLTRRVDFFVTTAPDRTTSLSLYIARLGLYVNPHGGSDADVYQFVFPSGLEHVPADQIRQYFVDHRARVPSFAASGAIDLKIDEAGCEVRIDLASPEGQPFPGNGVHRASRCGSTRP